MTSSPETNVVRVHMASPLHGSAPEPVRLDVSEPIPSDFCERGMKGCEAQYDCDANRIYQALKRSLPQGTMHRLLGYMFEGHANLYRGPMP